MPKRLRLISHPFHNGLEGVDVGAGPVRLLSDPELTAELRAQGWDVRSEVVATPEPSDPEIVRIAEGDIELAFERLHVHAAAITAYDPALDADGRVARAASEAIRTIGQEALRQ